MALHLVKLCVGVDHPDQLTAWGRELRGKGRAPIVHTRNRPRRAEELLDGGSLYWVIRGAILCRQPIHAIRTLGEGQAVRCEIDLAPDVVLTHASPRRPFQGWRYLEPEKTPPDLAAGMAAGDDLPPDLARKLRDLGAW